MGARDAVWEGPEADPGTSASSRGLGEASGGLGSERTDGLPRRTGVRSQRSQRQGHRPRKATGCVPRGRAGRRTHGRVGRGQGKSQESHLPSSLLNFRSLQSLHLAPRAWSSDSLARALLASN
uniref:Uncharacterized protein n=1 Tax=Molossus molossus TaxID=27622 RepID=A0A7J8BLJ9_MOLMO|nr:hypothetical protein HJG59_010167 [Molossus molossus]